MGAGLAGVDLALKKCCLATKLPATYIENNILLQQNLAYFSPQLPRDRGHVIWQLDENIRLLDLNRKDVAARAGLESSADRASRRPDRRRYVTFKAVCCLTNLSSLFVRWRAAVRPF